MSKTSLKHLLSEKTLGDKTVSGRDIVRDKSETFIERKDPGRQNGLGL